MFIPQIKRFVRYRGSIKANLKATKQLEKVSNFLLFLTVILFSYLVYLKNHINCMDWEYFYMKVWNSLFLITYNCPIIWYFRLIFSKNTRFEWTLWLTSTRVVMKCWVKPSQVMKPATHYNRVKTTLIELMVIIATVIWDRHGVLLKEITPQMDRQ